MKIYIAGPMTGLPDLNFPAFHAAAKLLRDEGHTVVNPAELNIEPGASWQQCMRIDIRELVTCEGIFLLPNWTLSRGARLEFHIASQLCMKVVEAWNFPPLRSISVSIDPATSVSEHAMDQVLNEFSGTTHYDTDKEVTGVPK
ncbi:DUF4406 domain-containing protein [Pusillimonas sp. NJUB218]|uniref:DUF4406 domain-containing protein n=1 Tax=Pusillimonas sp. NJUB218 TaxID=2023230 RepID=UPI000F4CD32D|nr:DUF4406 domain-containing protein [Pusillimonas sp. NJUB218]ROT46097.1 hypothetical protein CHR62_03730 [Pusillimonas sp. NJUB218]